jgi:hypothetical protein
MATGENSTTWGNVTNVNLGTAMEEAIVGTVDVPFTTADVTLALTNSNASQSARNLRLNLTGTPASDFNLIIPATTGSPSATFEKPYIINNTTGRTITVKHPTGTGVAVPTGKTMWVYANGTNVVDVVTHLSSVTLGSALPVASGGTGVNTSTGTGSVVLSASPSFTGTVNFGPAIITGSGVSTGDAQIELGGNRSGSGLAYLDLHAISGGDFQARLVRYGGANGGLDLIQTGTGGMVISNEGSADTVFKTNALERMRITNAGDVGIGTATPATKVAVYGGVSGTDTRITIGNAASALQVGVDSSNQPFLYGNAAFPLLFYTNTVERFRIASAGQWGLGGANYGTSGQVLTSQGAGSAPIWSTASSGVTSVSGTGSANGLSLSGTVTSTGNITLSGSVTSVATTATIDGVTIGYRSIPRSTTSGTAVVADVGKCIAVTAGITIPNSTFAAGDAISIYNDSGSAITITAGVTTLRLGGTTTTGNRTLAARGLATIWFNSATEAVISGAGVS